MPWLSSPFGRGQPSVSEAGEGVFKSGPRIYKALIALAALGRFSRREKNAWLIALASHRHRR